MIRRVVRSRGRIQHWALRSIHFPSPADLLTSPTGLMALLYGRGSAASTSSEAASTNTPSTAAAGSAANADTPPNPSSSSSSSKRSKSFLPKESIWLAIAIICVTAGWEFVQGRSEKLQKWLAEYLYVTLEIRSHQPEYDMLMLWLSRQRISATTRNMAVKTTFVMGLSELDEGPQCSEEDGNGIVHTSLVPGYGTHIVNFRGHRLYVVRSLDDSKKNVQGSFRRLPDEIVSITVFSRSRKVIEELIAEIRHATLKQRERRVPVNLPNTLGDDWDLLCHRSKRPLSSIYLPDTTMTVVDEVAQFLCLRKKYASLGVPWRRGYLFVGPPGTGKSSFIFCLASNFSLPVFLLGPKRSNVSDCSFLRLINSLPERSVLVLEDLDLFCDGATSEEGNRQAATTSLGVSVSGLLNALDGVASSEGRLLFVTTNDMSRLPKALLRPGRIDRVVSFKSMEGKELGRMAEAFAHAVSLDPSNLSATLAAKAPMQDTAGWTPAEWQNTFLNDTVLGHVDATAAHH